MNRFKIALILLTLTIILPITAAITIDKPKDWTGEFNGTSATRNDNSGDLGIGYRNGSADTNLTKGLVGYWRMDRNVAGDGGTVKDYSGNNNDAITRNGVNTSIKGIISTNASRFSSDEYIDTEIDENYNTGSFTISAWIKTYDNTINGQRVVVDDENNNGYAISLGDGGTGSLRFFIRGKDDTVLDTASNLIENGKWYHVVGVYDNEDKNRYIYVNGERNASITSDTGSASTDSGTVNIGGEASESKFFHGKIDEVRIYNRSLSKEEIRKLYFYGRDGRFNGEYVRSIDNEPRSAWKVLEIDADIPSDTDVDAEFRSVYSNDTTFDSKSFDVKDGLHNYTLSVKSRAGYELKFSGYSSNLTRSWVIKKVEVYGEDLSNVTLNMSFSGGDVYVDGEPAEERTYSESELDFPYIMSDQPTAGIISYRDVEEIRYSKKGSTDRFYVTQEGGGSFLIPNTRGGYGTIEDKEREIQNKNFLGGIEPSFGFNAPEEPLVKVIYDPKVDLHGFTRELRNSFEIYARHMIDQNPGADIKLGPT